ncbi:hypothetical protein Tco_0704316 [Tanacetum coccineum]|uniref:Uncharacterized protein n=1 Tax=Tanacetum coccineum TaxID=301880 RepID=A0ABQ4Y1A8_9ASTR
MELVLEQTQQGPSYEVSVSVEGVEELKRKVKINGEKKEALLTLRQKLDSILQAGNPVKEILLKLNLPDHRSILTDSKIHIKMVMEGKVDSSKALDAGLVVTECNEKKSESQWLRYNCLLNIIYMLMKQEKGGYSEQSESVYDTYELEKVDRNTIPKSTDMSHRGGEIYQKADDEKCQVSFLKNGQHGQILNETSNKAKIKKEIEVLETINIELEHSVAKLLTENEKLHKENEHLKQTYKDLYDSIKKTRVQTKDHNDSLIAKINSKTVENADLKAQIQEKVFANVALKNELRKLKGNSVDTKFAKPSILGKPVLQPPRNQSVVRQPNAFKSERPNFSKPQFASQVDVNNVLSKPVTPHYLPKVRESVFVKPHHVIASGSSRNSSKE